MAVTLSMSKPTYICSVFLVMVGCVSSDFAKDKKECQNQLIGLSPCLSFVSGEAKTPSIECCTVLRPVINRSTRCLCLLVKDRHDPNLGFKINATLALSLPSLCHVHANISNCPALLHLPPHSKDARVFEQFVSNANKKGHSEVAAGIHRGSSSSAGGSRWVGFGWVCRVYLSLLASLFISSAWQEQLLYQLYL